MVTHRNTPLHRSTFALLILTAIPLFLTAGSAKAADELPPGSAKGTFAVKGEVAVSLAFAAAFVDEKDDRTPIILILSDKKLPTGQWTSEFDLLRNSSKLSFTGVLYFFDKKGDVFRTDIYWHGRHSSVGGFFKLKLDAKPEKKVSGSAGMKDADEDAYKLDVTFHAVLR